MCYGLNLPMCYFCLFLFSDSAPLFLFPCLPLGYLNNFLNSNIVYYNMASTLLCTMYSVAVLDNTIYIYKKLMRRLVYDPHVYPLQISKPFTVISFLFRHSSVTL